MSGCYMYTETIITHAQKEMLGKDWASSVPSSRFSIETATNGIV